MGTSAPPVPGGEAPAAAAEPAKPGVSAVQAAVDKARASAAPPAGAAAPGAVPAAAEPVVPAAPVVPENETPEQKAQREEDERVLAAETPEQKTAREAEEAAAAGAAPEELVVRLPLTRHEGDEPFEIELDSKESAELLRMNLRGALRAEQAQQIRESAQAMRDEAEQITYAVELDPAGVVLERITAPADVDHLFRFIATRPGVLERSAEFLAGLIEDPKTILAQAALAEAQRITRREEVKGKVDERKQVDDNARAILRTTQRSIDSLAPEGWTEEQRAALYKHTLSEARDFCTKNNLRTMDVRRIPGMIQSILASYGVAPRTSGAPKPATPAPGGGKAPSASTTQPTVDQIKAARARRQAAASAPPGAGTPAAGGIPKPPKYDPKQPGSPIQQAARAVRRAMGLAAKGPS